MKIPVVLVSLLLLSGCGAQLASPSDGEPAQVGTPQLVAAPPHHEGHDHPGFPKPDAGADSAADAAPDAEVVDVELTCHGTLESEATGVFTFFHRYNLRTGAACASIKGGDRFWTLADCQTNPPEVEGDWYGTVRLEEWTLALAPNGKGDTLVVTDHDAHLSWTVGCGGL